MIKPNYSTDTFLLPYEEEDYDTLDHAYGIPHPTGINTNRMRLPTRYDLSKFYKRYKINANGKRKGEYGTWEKRETPLLDFSSDFDWQITYRFPDTLRNNITANGVRYGGDTVTFRRLYLILCERFNQGEFFIDEYFKSVYPNSYVKVEVDNRLNKIKADLIDYASSELSGAVATKSGEFDKRYKSNIGMKSKRKRYEEFAQQWADMEGEELARLIKYDIINSLATGIITLHGQTDSKQTIYERRSAGVPETPKFYATTQLINSLILYVHIGGNKKWQTRQGILV